MATNIVDLDYTNWRGERRFRPVVPVSIRFGHNEWHKELQWLLVAYDLEKDETREFAMSKIHEWRPRT